MQGLHERILLRGGGIDAPRGTLRRHPERKRPGDFIVLTTSTFIATGGIAVQLPKASRNSEETLKVRTIEIDRKGTIYFTGAPVTIPVLKETLKPLDRNSPFLIRADRDLQLQTFVDVLDTVKNSGFQKVSLQTERK